jgi:hypothetical protein
MAAVEEEEVTGSWGCWELGQGPIHLYGSCIDSPMVHPGGP